MFLLCAIELANAQAENPSPTDSKASAATDAKPRTSPLKPVQPYRLDFSLNELQDGKRANTRHYALNLIVGSGDEIKIGTRVPVRTGPKSSDANPLANTQWQYMDVGTNIWAAIREAGDEVQLEVKGEVSDLDKGPSTDLAPIVRQMKLSGSTLLVTGKPILIGSMDDPNSTREFQLEVTATKLR
jgi:hypothetical protein